MGKLWERFLHWIKRLNKDVRKTDTLVFLNHKMTKAEVHNYNMANAISLSGVGIDPTTLLTERDIKLQLLKSCKGLFTRLEYNALEEDIKHSADNKFKLF